MIGRAAVYYTSLLINVGCHTDAHEQARWFGDDIALKAEKYGPHGLQGFRAYLNGLRRLGAGRSPLGRLHSLIAFARSGHRELDAMLDHHARLAASLAAELGLSEEVQVGLRACYEQWDGKGWPGERAGEAIPIASRLAQLAEFIEVRHREGGVQAAVALARRRAGRQFDPALVAHLCGDPEAILWDLESIEPWQAVLQAEPAPHVVLDGAAIDGALEAVADFFDLKSPFTVGHSRAVTKLVVAAGIQAGLPPEDIVVLRRAGLVHDFGRLGISNGIWDKPGQLGPGERERLRLYPYLTERMLCHSPSLARVGQVAAGHQERLDGSGYPRGLRGDDIPVLSRLLAAADAYHTKREPRPHRPPLGASEAAAALRAEVRAGRLDASAVDAVLAATGHRVWRRQEGVAGLTAREIEVLRLVARGKSTLQIARALTISTRTAGHHIENIYLKPGATNRASAALFAMRHGLIYEEEFVEPG